VGKGLGRREYLYELRRLDTVEHSVRKRKRSDERLASCIP
jgi:hypothetical protein